MIRTIKIIISIIRYIFSVFVIALLAVVLVQRISNNSKSVAGIRIFTVVTESMVPEYKVGASILTKAVSPEELQIGDDISYLGKQGSFADKIVTHRIIDKNKNEDGSYTFSTKGIANDEKDPEINETQIYGKVIYKIKTISYLNGIMGNLYGMYFLIVIPMAFIIVSEIISFRKGDKEESDKLKEHKDRKERRKKRRNQRRPQWEEEKKGYQEDSKE